MAIAFRIVNEVDIVIPEALFTDKEGRTVSFQVFNKIWASVRKRINEQFGIDIFAWFKPRNNGVTEIHYNLSYANIPNGITEEAYRRLFWTTFPEWSLLFENVVQSFVEAEENGLKDYVQFLNNCNGSADNIVVVNAMINRFLCGIGIRKQGESDNGTPEEIAASRIARKNLERARKEAAREAEALKAHLLGKKPKPANDADS